MKLRRPKPIPSSVDASKKSSKRGGSDRSVGNEYVEDTDNLQYGSSTPGTMAKAPRFSSSFGLFQKNNNMFDSDADTVNSSHSTRSKRLGIARRRKSKSRDELSVNTNTSHRIGIIRPNYELPEDSLPLPPLPLAPKTSSPTPNLVDADSSQSDGDQPKVVQKSNVHNVSLEEPSSPRTTSSFGSESRPGDKQTTENHELINSPRSEFSLLSKDEITTEIRVDDIVSYTPFVTTVTDLLEMIPGNATEPTLGSQSYVGLCYPGNGEELRADMTQRTGEASRINLTRGQIVVAIPVGGFTGSLCARIAKPILADPKVASLLNHSDSLPLDRRSNRHHKKKRRNKTSTKKLSALPIETVHEEECSTINDESTSSSLSSYRKKERKKEREIFRMEQDKVRKAIEHAAKKAASSNAGITENEQSSSSIPILEDSSMEIWRTTMNLRSRSSLRRGPSVGDSFSNLSCDQSTESSIIDSSVTSLDGSLSLSASCSDCQYGFKRIPRRRTRRRHTKKQRNSHLTRVVPLVIVFMVVRYAIVSSGQQAQAGSEIFGIRDATICAFLFYMLCKMQLYLQGQENPMNHPVYKLLVAGLNSLRRRSKIQS